jgi:ABC-type Fe3+-hydroxamate transport system substrate-binding protein
VRVLLFLAVTAILAAACGQPSSPPPDPAPAARAELRVVSLNPSLTAILLALGAGDSLVGVDDFSARQEPEVAGLPRVGGLFNPSLEAVAGLSPDIVVLVPSAEQRDFRERLEALGVPVGVFENIRFDQVLDNIEGLGRIVGREREAAERIAAIRRARASAEALTAGRTRPSTLLVLQRDPLFVVGRGSFIDEMLASAGGRNLGAEFPDPYPRVAIEWMVARAPDVLLDMSPEGGDPVAWWSQWPALPAVKHDRVLRLDPKIVTLPGPWLDRSIESLVAALHGPELAARLGVGG